MNFQVTHAKNLKLTTGYTGLHGGKAQFFLRAFLCVTLCPLWLRFFAAAENVRRIQSGSTEDDALNSHVRAGESISNCGSPNFHTLIDLPVLTT
jgi:hypothetical protein